MRLQFVVVCAAVGLALAGCAAPGAEPSPTDPSASPTPSATASPTPTPESLTIVECEVMLPIDQARAIFAEDTEFLGERPPTESGGWFPLAEIDSTLADAAQAKACTWGVPNSDGVFTIHAVEVTAEQRSSLEAALADEGFTDVSTGTATSFEKSGETEVSPIAATHLFSGPLWIMANSNDLSTTGAVANAALEAHRTANPTLGL
ncbi:hypothetical protein [Mycetocola sp. 2940]|uniref:hypothetical protein n=1 Tax=Mycetocola sp. 2940 TaxID=3156452 RepID=UPI003395E296